MRVLMVFCLFVHLNYCNAQIKEIEIENFKVLIKEFLPQEIIFKSDSTRKVLKISNINPFLKMGLHFMEGYSEDSNPCWMSYDSSIHHIPSIDTLLNFGIHKANIKTFTRINMFKEYVIATYSILVNVGESNKELQSGGKIYDVNGSQIFETVGLPEKVINLGIAKIDSSGKYLVTIRSDHFEESEEGYLNPLDFYMDIFSIPEFKLLKTEKVSSQNLNYNNGRIWHITSYYDRVTKKHSEEVFFLDFNKNKKYTIHPEGSFGFSQSIEKAWLSDGILLVGPEMSFLKKTFERDFLIKEIIKK